MTRDYIMQVCIGSQPFVKHAEASFTPTPSFQPGIKREKIHRFYVILLPILKSSWNMQDIRIYNMGMVEEPIHVTDSAFEKSVLQSSLPVIVDFWAPWCGPCKMVAPILEKLAKEYSGKVIVAKVNTDENPEWAGKFGVQGIPTMLFVSGGKVVHRQVGALPERMLRDVVSQFMEVAASN